ncbi:DUF3558 domain-containing protein [Saccharopolyspora sp. 6M]|uniref:DUF3558 domain-containing protein n=1 Tax=Saccharopolyspora sp. 6M TaxID=2877237 RepID=UPI001CD56749|nr:DUF3558 domain-containing protein [Saccharopolyspora sp. 6M]MCA1228699.1 DUF3558 domain-containing protein [Saccharopolyspora sp. 6M]
MALSFRFGVAVFAAFLASGCAVGGSSGGEAPGSDSRPTSEINDPRDAASVQQCSLLKSEDIQALGLSPDGKVKPNELDPSMPDNCTWESDDGKKSLAVTVFPGRSIQQYRDNSDSYVDFSEMVIAGHPAVQANASSPEGGSCGIFLGTKDDQVVSAVAIDFTKAEKPYDPCPLAKSALEASVPTLPAAK